MKRFLCKSKTWVGTGVVAAIFLGGCGGSTEDFVFTNTIPQVAPVAADDAFNALGNATVNQEAAGVLANDTLNGAAISSFDPIGDNGGSIALNADGSFAYTPLFGFVGQETFQYTISNNAGTSTASVTMTSTGFGHFVDNTAAPDGNGSQASPFDTLTEAINVANAGDTVFVSRGDGTNTGLAGAVTVPPGVDLIGEGTGLILPKVVVPQGLAPSLTGPITCGGENIVSGLDIDGSASDGIIIDGVGNVTISNNTISNPTLEHISGDSLSGTNVIDNNVLNQPPNNNQDFIGIENVLTDGDVTVTNNTFANTNNQAVDACIAVAGISSDMNVVIEGNSAEGTVVDEFLTCITVVADGVGQVTSTIQDNRLKNFSSNGIAVASNVNTATVQSVITGNTIDAGANGILCGATGTISVTDNVVSDCDFGIIGVSLTEGMTLIAENNNISGCAAAVSLQVSADMAVAIRNNSLLGSQFFSVDVFQFAAANLCLAVTGNTVDDSMDIDTNEVGANIDLENGAAGLETVNTFDSGMPIINQTGTGTVTNRDAGFCQIP